MCAGRRGAGGGAGEEVPKRYVISVLSRCHYSSYINYYFYVSYYLFD
jgi:hypothetical protein